MIDSISKQWQKLPAPVALFAQHALSLLVGFASAFVMFYLLYRIGLPSKPFIYVSF